MRILWLCLLFQSVLYSEADFGTPHLVSSRLCKNWSCVNSKLGLQNALPPRDQYTQILKSLLPFGAWQDVIGRALDTCYGVRPRNYVGTCPGQALLHCTIDNLIENCPEESWRKDDGCYPVTSLAGTKYMFTQSRYENLEKNLPTERRPAWFMRNYFNSKCCNLPKLINSTVLLECGFNNFITYYDHRPRTGSVENQTNFMKQRPTQIFYNSGISDFNSIPVTEKRPDGYEDTLQVVSLYPESNSLDALSCCDMSDFIDPSWQSECGFTLNWDKQSRLKVAENLALTTAVPPTTTAAPLNKDVRVVPLSCEKETCVFQNLNVITESGSVDIDAFSKLLDNFTSLHPSWAKARARVITMCISRPNHGYQADCEINKLLACTLDVLSENCPYGSKNDSCRHSRRNNTICQISSSRYRAKNRRAVCGLPNLVSSDVLAACGLTSVSRTEYVPEYKPKMVSQGWKNSKYSCKDSTPPTTCIMTKMGVLNKYGFMDYFGMKDRIRAFTTKHREWSALVDVYINAFSGMPMYRKHCNSPKKLLNVVDAMLMTCPITKRRNTPKCTELFANMTNAAPVSDNQNVTKEKLTEILQHFNHMFLPSSQLAKKTVYKQTNPLFNFGMLNSTNIPPVKLLDLKTTKQIPIILPVYMRLKNDLLRANTASTAPYKNGVFQTPSFLLHGKIPSFATPTPMFPNMP